jgi:hypothetical protein
MTDAPTPDALRPGELVGPWRIEGYAGSGSYGLVYRARRAGHPGSVPVALKLARFPYDPRFLREVELLSRTHHPSVPELVDRGWWHSSVGRMHPYVVMQWVNGHPLYTWARVHNPSSRRVLEVVAQMSWALEVLHTAGGLHRDVKGDNILVEPDGRAFLTDFGSGTWDGAPPLTESLMPPGTREYRGPEALRFQWHHLRKRGARYEARTFDDLYALGVSTYRLVTGQYPPPGTDPEARLDPIGVPPPPRDPPQKLNPRVIPELAALIERMLAADPEARGLARDIAQAAEAAAEHAGPEADVPLAEAAPSSVRPVAVPVRVVAKVEVPPVAAKPLPVKAATMPARVPTELPVHEVAERAKMAMLGTIPLLIALALLWMDYGPHARSSTLTTAEELEQQRAREAAEAAVADASVPSSVVSQERVIATASISLDMPVDPLPNQRRPPCKPREVVIRGGCWLMIPNLTPPCDDDIYAWKGACYLPRYERTRPPTSKDPRK